MANEKRLIDVNALIEWIDIGHLRNPLETCFSERDVVDMLESRQTVDAVEVVCCRDCKHFDAGDEFNRPLCTHPNGLKTAHESLYCPFGERRTDG